MDSNTTRDNEEGIVLYDDGVTGNAVRFNLSTGNTLFDLVDRNLPACVNTWQLNLFATDNEGNGPLAGCIR